MSSRLFVHCHPEVLLETVDGDKELFLQLAEIFRRESVAIFAQMQAAATQSNWQELGRQSHSLKGTVGPLGANQLVQTLVDIEDECLSGNYVGDEKRLAEVQVTLHGVGAELQRFVDQL